MIDSISVKGLVFSSDGDLVEIRDTIPFRGREIYRFGPWHSDALVDVWLGKYQGGNASVEVDGRNGRIVSGVQILRRRDGVYLDPEFIQVGKPYEIRPTDVVQIIGTRSESFVPSIVISAEKPASTTTRSRR